MLKKSNMIDLHTHILPGIDDGADSVEKALSMLQILNENQINRVVCTPHFDPSNSSIKDFVQKRAAALRSLGDTKVTLIAGSETLLHEYLFYYTDITPLSIDNTGNILLELPFDKKWDPMVFRQLERLRLTYHLQPIIAHVERYEAVNNHRHKNILQLQNAGCLLQMDSDFILKEKTRRQAIGYLKRGYIDIIASDCHNTDKRSPNLAQAYDIILQKLGRDYQERLMVNAEQVLSGERYSPKTGLLIK